MATEKALRAAAKEMQDVMGLEPPINVKAPIADLTEQLKEAIEQIQEGDEFSKTTQAIIDEFNATDEEEEEEVVAPKRKKATAPAPKKKAPVVEDDEEEEEEEEEEDDEPEEEVVVPKKKGAKKPAKKVVEENDEEEDEDEEEAPAPKKGKGKLTPFKGTKETLGTSRMIEIAKAMAKIKGSQDVETVAKAGDAGFVKAGGASNLKQSKNIIKVLLPAAETWGIVTVKGDKLSN